MENSAAFRSTEHVQSAIDDLAAFARALDSSVVPAPVRARLTPMLADLLGAVVAGMRTPEMRALVGAWASPAGDAPILGTSLTTTPEQSAYLAATAACVLELDEGNKYAAGHPAAHVVFAALASAQSVDRPVSGEEFLTAVVAGYEVAARFGRATHRRPDWHTHGHWGATGAATASALIGGGTASEVAGAIDAATGLMHVTPWSTVLSGSFTRNLWMAGANVAGLHAARLARAGLVTNTGQAQHSLGTIVGTLDVASLTDGLGGAWLTAGGYLKQHASCSYTHAAVDIVQSLRRAASWQPEDVRRVTVVTHSLAKPLLGRHPENRLAAMFSLPFVVSNAVVNGRVDPDTMEPGTAPFAAAEAFSDRVEVQISERLDAELPGRRCTEVVVELADGTALSLGQPNPVGDADHFPLEPDQVRRKLATLVGPPTGQAVWAWAEQLASADSVSAGFEDLAGSIAEHGAPAGAAQGVGSGQGSARPVR
ncbi:MAG: MmgE/PrpD family protein [Marmoricola sp.]